MNSNFQFSIFNFPPLGMVRSGFTYLSVALASMFPTNMLADNRGTTYTTSNPICPMGVYVADPTARVAADGKLYIYGSLDTSTDKYCSKDYHVLSTENLSDWTIYRNAFSDSIDIYAPDMIYRNGMYHLYYEHPNGDEYVAESRYPMGPFKGGVKIEGPKQIDPCVFIDDDGRAYYFWGQFSAKGAMMNPDMKTIDQKTIKDGIVTEDDHHFHEGGYVIKRGKYYYFIFADISRRDRPTCLGYAMATSPLGPYEYRGVIIDNWGCDPETWNNHGSLVEYRGQWYVLYHRSTHGSRMMRKACIEPIKFNADGTIDEVEMTSQGAGGPLNAFEKIDAAKACMMGGHVRIECMEKRGDREHLSQIHNGDWAAWKYIDFGSGAQSMDISVRSSKRGKITLHIDGLDGKVIGEVNLTPHSTITSLGALQGTPTPHQYQTITIPIRKTRGVHAVYMNFERNGSYDDESFSIDWFRFYKKQVAESNKQEAIASLRDGFIHIPDSIQTAVYWYWLNNNISREGVVRDLEAMKRVGINRAFIGNQATNDLPYGEHKLFSDEWWNITHQALKTASELGIEIGMFNCPGWSQSGGPWIKPEESMKYLAFHEQNISSQGGKVAFQLPKIENGKIVNVMAYPKIKGEKMSWTISPMHKERIKLKLNKPFTARTIALKSDRPYSSSVHIYANGKEIKNIEFDRHNASLNVGFEPLAPVVITIPETLTTEYEIAFDQPSPEAKIDVTISEIPAVEKYAEKSLAKVFQDPLPMWDYYMWDTPAEATDRSMYIDTDEIVDITPLIAKGATEWDAPYGDWTILTAYMQTTGVTNSPAVKEGTGLEVDKINKEYISSHFDSYIGEIIRRIPKEDRRSWNIVVEDSYETGSLNWTDDMKERFISTYDYDPTPFLPTLRGYVVESVDKSERFLWDLRRLIADRVAYDYVGGLRDECHKHGMTSWLENYGHWGFPGEFLMYGGQSDEVSGEFWSEGTLGDIENRAASSCAHTYGKTKVWAESCTAGGPQFNRYPRLMKQRVDRFFCEGINASLLHLFIQQPDSRKPGLDAWFGNEFNRNNSWFEGMGTFVDYLKRCSFLLQQGRYMADAAYFIGEDVPKMTGTCQPSLPQGYSFDYINAEILINNSHVENGKLTLDSGMQYDVLVLPQQSTMRPEVLRKIYQLVSQGLTIVGPAPVRSPSMKDYDSADKEIETLTNRMWTADGRCGEGHVYTEDTTMEKIFTDMGLHPDIEAPSSLLFIHRKLSDGSHIYFISNQEEKAIESALTFRIGTGYRTEQWNPLTGATSPLPFDVRNGRTSLTITLDRLESTFIIFTPSAMPQSPAPSSITNIGMNSPSWNVTFAPSAGEQGFSRIFDRLADWITLEDRMKYYSGNATYSNTFTLGKEDARGTVKTLKLGSVMVLAEVKINGENAGGAWTYPYDIDITPYVREGENTVDITVYNNWRNRLIGDEKLPVAERKTWTNIQPWASDDELQSSGLLGPVNIEITK